MWRQSPVFHRQVDFCWFSAVFSFSTPLVSQGYWAVDCYEEVEFVVVGFRFCTNAHKITASSSYFSCFWKHIAGRTTKLDEPDDAHRSPTLTYVSPDSLLSSRRSGCHGVGDTLLNMGTGGNDKWQKQKELSQCHWDHRRFHVDCQVTGHHHYLGLTKVTEYATLSQILPPVWNVISTRYIRY